MFLSANETAEVRKRIAADRSGVIADTQLFVRVYTPPPRMVIVGAVHIAQALAPMARIAGFDVTVIDPREAFVRSGNLANINAIVAWPDEAMDDVAPDVRTAIITLTHDPKLDDPALAAALRSPAFYIGALGSRKTHAKRLRHGLAGDGFSETDLARIHGPVGLDIDAVTPAEIACQHHRPSGRHLARRGGLMRFGSFTLDAAKGLILAHVPFATAAVTLRKGHVLTADDIAVFVKAGKLLEVIGAQARSDRRRRRCRRRADRALFGRSGREADRCAHGPVQH